MKLTAANADRHDLYQRSVQDVESEIEFVDTTFKKLRGRFAQVLREDFCGTANTCCQWVRQRDDNRGIGVDLDAEVLSWGTNNNIAQLSPDQAARVELLQRDVRETDDGGLDIVLAMNFSYFLFETRADMLRYFVSVFESLRDDGIFFLDCYGGYDAPRVLTEERECDGFTYIWDQASFNPISSLMQCYIHFTFEDGSRMDKAFAYHWRLWTLPELLGLLQDAGFSRTTVYWEGTDEETGEGDGIYTPATVGDADAGWICYLTAEK
ncbi:MAG: hypothetical protein DHS20C11_22550 [Lysobacteraceae bacterium]|nr:MAG: hypothetical protein DHS20C11_22550 [Xanthomonadaceae bacterium]